MDLLNPNDVARKLCGVAEVGFKGSRPVVELMRVRAAEQLEGKQVWRVATAPTQTAAADALARCLLAVGEVGIASRRAKLEPAQPLIASASMRCFAG